METITGEQLKQTLASCKQDPDNAPIFVDIREPGEYAKEHVSGSINLPMSTLNDCDKSQFQGKTVIFFCMLGRRTQMAAAQLAQLDAKAQYCVAGGLAELKQYGCQIKTDSKAPIDVMRQVQITVGFMVLIGIVLSHFVYYPFIFISVFFAGGLLFAGLSGWCGMAKLLMKLPYNQYPPPK